MIVKIKNQFCDRFIEINDGTDRIVNSSGYRDSHGHIMWLGMKTLGLNLENTKSLSEILELTKKYSNDNLDTKWIEGRGWNNEIWKPSDEINLKIIDSYFPDKPVFLKRIDGHAAWANSKALSIANINNSTPHPEGGFIHKDSNDNITGLLVDNAMELVNSVIPKHSKEELKRYILTGIDKLAELGVVATCDMDVHIDWYEAFKELAEENKLKIQIDQYYRGFDGKWQEIDLRPKEINNLYIKGTKYFADGAIGSRGAAMLSEYSDDPGNKGLFLISKNELLRNAKEAASKGFEISTHAIGDAANRMVLDVYELLRKEGIKNTLRVEHAQIVHPDDIFRFAKYNIEAHIQPIHCISDENMAESRIGERVKYSYPWKTLVDLGVKVFGGSDYPIESHDPLLGINYLVEPKIKWQESEKLAIEKALKIYEF